ncbi:NADP-dependent oxidoreductase [Mucilaginibacter flavidus]|uniref:NADP-dependent oxidoreductase n=1 Tax=Mucilaginibacter flavidus TaxID=2949309 RepID=UPI002092E351|nr:NADP-dependent oxidoreductase [Mucilaginibacter flavidus]MCO5950920.1 NADP-dependent oxidoreductase [Mucilaginibacter flavidus]
MNKVILLYKRPVGKPVLSDFKFAIEEVPVAANGELLLKTLYVSVDPYLRGRMNDSKSYVPPFQLNKPVQSGIVAEVIGSNRTDFKIGDFVSGNLEWKEYQISVGSGLSKINDSAENLSKYLGILGMTGLTAYCGLTEIGDPKEGETIVVSGAAGAVGSVVGQIGKILGCRVVGITGADEKVDLLKSKFHFDQAINYKTAGNLKEAIGNACPAGVDVYFDNVGGEISDAVLANINKYARIPLCGAISLYNETKPPIGPRIQPVLLVKSSLMRGFIVSDFSDKFPGAIKQLASWLKEGKLTYAETIVEGFNHIPQAFLDLFEGKNEGKMIVKI